MTSPEPIFSASTERLWALLPDVHRELDALQLTPSGQAFPFKRWLSGMGDLVGQLETLLDRFLPTPATWGGPWLLDTQSGRLQAAKNGATTSISGAGTPNARTNLGTNARAEAVVYVPAGTFTVSFRSIFNSAGGIARVDVDGVEVGSVDTYNATNSIVTVAVGSVDLARGYHAVTASWTGLKNASSTNTSVNVISLSLTQTAAVPSRTSDLVDPAGADDAWLPWLGQLLGVTLPPSLSPAERRDAVTFASSGFRSGTKGAVADAARSVLTGTRYARVYDHSIPVNGVLTPGGQWDVTIVTRATETPATADVVAAVVRKAAKPAGVKLYTVPYAASWDTIEAQLPSWDAWEARGSWDRVQEAGLS